MTSIVISGANAFRMWNTDLSGVDNYMSRLLTATEARFFDNADNYQSFTGADLTYDPDGNMTGGTITGAVTVEAGLERIVMTDFSIAGDGFWGCVLANDIDGVWDLMLAGADVIQGGNGADELLGGTGGDQLYGNNGTDTLKGETGNDSLYGGNSGDILIGGTGRDTLDGGLRSDILNGGTGVDTFVFSEALSAVNIDKIQDFRPVDDTISLDRADFTPIGLPGTLAASRFYIGAAAHDASDRIIYDSATGRLYFDSDGNGPNAQVQFALLTKGLAMTEADFVIY